MSVCLFVAILPETVCIKTKQNFIATKQDDDTDDVLHKITCT